MSAAEGQGEAAPRKSGTRDTVESIVVAVILALFIRTFVVQAFKIPTGSMETNLLIGDHLLVNKVVYSPSLGGWEAGLLGKREVRRGDVVVFKYPEEPARDFIKRVIGLPGERLEIPLLEIDEAVERDQVAFLQRTKAGRDNGAVREGLEALKRAAAGGQNLMIPLLDCARRYTTLGETSDALTAVFGEFREQPFY